MSSPSTITLQLTAAQSTGIALSQTPGAAGNLTLNGALVTTGVANLVSAGAAARRVSIASAGADSARIFTLRGTDRFGNAQSETITGVATPTAVGSVLDYATVTSVAVDAATAGAITVGTNSIASSEWVLDNIFPMSWALSVAVSIASGAANYTVEHTYSDPNKTGTSLVASPQQFAVNPRSPVPPVVWPDGTLTAKTVNGETNFANQPIFAHRVTVNSGTGLVVMESIQADYMRG